MAKDTQIDTKMVIGVKPYSDESGYGYTVCAERMGGAVIGTILSGTAEINFDISDWGFIAAAMDRAFRAVDEVGEDR